MTAAFELIHQDGGNKEELWSLRDEASGLVAFWALCPGQREPAFGGIRRREYAGAEAARSEAQALARQMATKLRFAGLPHGGAKTVVVDHPALKLEAACRVLGTAIENLGGRYVCGPDMGMGKEALDWLRRETAFVNDAGNDAGVSTARGVHAGLQAGAEYLGWNSGLSARRVLIQGVGAVGGALARLLAAAGALPVLWDLDVRRADLVCDEIQRAGGRAEVVGASFCPEETDADVFCPCGPGGTVTENGRVFRLIGGSANGQLQHPGVARILHDHGTLWLPEGCVNAGAVIEGVLVHEGGAACRAEARQRIDETRDRVLQLLMRAREEGQSPAESLSGFWGTDS